MDTCPRRHEKQIKRKTSFSYPWWNQTSPHSSPTKTRAYKKKEAKVKRIIIWILCCFIEQLQKEEQVAVYQHYLATPLIITKAPLCDKTPFFSWPSMQSQSVLLPPWTCSPPFVAPSKRYQICFKPNNLTSIGAIQLRFLVLYAYLSAQNQRILYSIASAWDC